MAVNANWTDAKVQFSFSSRDNQAKNASFSTGAILTLLVFGIMIILGVIGTIIEITKAGDIPDLNYEKLNTAAKFNTVQQYEPLLI